MPAARLDATLRALVDGGVELVLIGGLAGIVHGAARATYDVDVVYARSPENVERLAAALGPLQPYLRGAPPGLPFRWDPATIRRGLNFTLTTSAGDVDLLGEVAGGGTYDELVPFTEKVEVFGRTLLCVTLPKLIELKRAAGRPRDLAALAEREVLLARRGPSAT